MLDPTFFPNYIFNVNSPPSRARSWPELTLNVGKTLQTNYALPRSVVMDCKQKPSNKYSLVPNNRLAHLNDSMSKLAWIPKRCDQIKDAMGFSWIIHKRCNWQLTDAMGFFSIHYKWCDRYWVGLTVNSIRRCPKIMLLENTAFSSMQICWKTKS